MSYKKDKRGEYSVSATWLDAWRGGGPYVSGFNTCEARTYTSGEWMIVRSDAKYAHSESPEVAALLRIYIESREQLMALCERKGAKKS